MVSAEADAYLVLAFREREMNVSFPRMALGPLYLRKRMEEGKRTTQKWAGFISKFCHSPIGKKYKNKVRIGTSSTKADGSV